MTLEDAINSIRGGFNLDYKLDSSAHISEVRLHEHLKMICDAAERSLESDKKLTAIEIAFKNLKDGFNKLEAENTLLRMNQHWQPIETAPRDGTRIMVCVKTYTGEIGSPTIAKYIHESWVHDLSTWDKPIPFYHLPKYWMPLPPPPGDVLEKINQGNKK